MKKLPELYKNKIELTSHNKKYCLVEENEIKDKDVENIIKSILSNSNYLNNIPIIIKTRNKEYRTSIVSKYNNKILTLDSEIIPISEIIDIEVL